MALCKSVACYWSLLIRFCMSLMYNNKRIKVLLTISASSQWFFCIYQNQHKARPGSVLLILHISEGVIKKESAEFHKSFSTTAFCDVFLCLSLTLALPYSNPPPSQTLVLHLKRRTAKCTSRAHWLNCKYALCQHVFPPVHTLQWWKKMLAVVFGVSNQLETKQSCDKSRNCRAS